MALIAGSIREFGFTNPVLVDGENGVIAGHGRLLAARKLGLDQVPVIELAHLTPAQKRAYILADNKLAERAGWDRELLALEVGELSELGMDLATPRLRGRRDRRAPARRRSSTRGRRRRRSRPPSRCPGPGDLWLSVRTGCSAATPPTPPRWRGCWAASSRSCMVADPPYGVDYDPAWRNASGASRTRRTGKVLNDDRADWRAAWALFPGPGRLRLARGAACRHRGGEPRSRAASRSAARSSGRRSGWC